MFVAIYQRGIKPHGALLDNDKLCQGTGAVGNLIADGDLLEGFG